MSDPATAPHAGTGKESYASMGFIMGVLAAMTVALTIATAFRSRIAAPQPASQPAHAQRSGASQIPPSANQDALSALQPTEMLQGCLDCPLSSYLGKMEILP
jgi:hypothetical protein